MSNAHQILVVGSVDCNDQVNTFMVSWSLGKPARVADEYGGPGIDIARVGAVDTSGLVESSFVVEVKGASVDAVTSIVAAISDALAALPPITIGLKNSANTGTLQPRIAECIELAQDAPWDSRLVNANATLIEIVVRRDPCVYAAAETLYSVDGIDAPALIPLLDQTGQQAAPLDITIAPPYAAGIVACYVGHTDDEGAVLADFVKPLAAATWSAGAASADAAGYPAGVGSTIWRHTAAAYTDVDVTNLAPGEYLVLANCAGTTANVDTIETPFSGPVLIPTTTLHLLPLGVVSLPNRVVRGSVTDLLRITITGGGAGEYAAVNYVALLPVSRGLIGWQVTAGHAHRLLWTDGTMYVEDVVKLNEAFGSSAPLRTLGGQLLLLAEQPTPGPVTHCDTSISAVPRWEQLPIATPPRSNQFVNDFAADSIKTLFIGTDVGGAGTVAVTGGELRLYGQADVDANIFYLRDAVNTALKRRYTFRFQQVASSDSGAFVPFGVLQRAGPITVETNPTGLPFDADRRIGATLKTNGNINIWYFLTAHARKSWNFTGNNAGTWQTTTGEAAEYGELATNTPYRLVFESENNGGAPRWRIILQNENGTEVYATTTWVAWSTIESVAGSYWIFGGEYYAVASEAYGYIDARYSLIQCLSY